MGLGSTTVVRLKRTLTHRSGLPGHGGGFGCIGRGDVNERLAGAFNENVFESTSHPQTTSRYVTSDSADYLWTRRTTSQPTDQRYALGLVGVKPAGCHDADTAERAKPASMPLKRTQWSPTRRSRHVSFVIFERQPVDDNLRPGAGSCYVPAAQSFPSVPPPRQLPAS